MTFKSVFTSGPRRAFVMFFSWTSFVRLMTASFDAVNSRGFLFRIIKKAVGRDRTGDRRHVKTLVIL